MSSFLLQRVSHRGPVATGVPARHFAGGAGTPGVGPSGGRPSRGVSNGSWLAMLTVFDAHPIELTGGTVKAGSARPATTANGDGRPSGGLHYKWIALSNTTLGMLLATLNASSLIIALPAIFRGIKVDPLDPANFTFLLWVLMGYLLVTAVLVVTLGRIGDIVGRVRMFNLGFAIFTLGAIALSLTWSTGAAGAIELIVFRMVQGVGGAMLMANSAAILTDAFPTHQRGMALGVNQIAALVGSFGGLILGGVLASIDWRWVFLVNVPVGILGTVWSMLKLREIGERNPAPHRLVGQRHVRPRADDGARRHHVRDQAVRRLADGLGKSVRPVDDRRRPDVARGVPLRGAACRGADVRPRAVPHPGVRLREPGRAARRDQPGRPAVPADHVAAGHLAAAARLRVRADTAVGRDLHGPADRRVHLRGPGIRLAVGPLRQPAVRDRGDAPGGASRSGCCSCCRRTSPIPRSPPSCS